MLKLIRKLLHTDDQINLIKKTSPKVLMAYANNL
jgi:hypothetical protein